MKNKFFTLIVLSILATGCAASRNLQNDLKGSDKIKPSPCAGCEEIQYFNPTSYEWVEIKNG